MGTEFVLKIEKDLTRLERREVFAALVRALHAQEKVGRVSVIGEHYQEDW